MAALALRFDRTSGRFRGPDGRFIAAARVRPAVDAYLAASGREATRLADDLRAGRISLEEWRLAMKDVIKSTHMNLTRVAKGGRVGMTAADNGRVGQIVRREYGFLERWVEQIKAGWVLDGRLTARARQYADAGGETFDLLERSEMAGRGMQQERNVLAATADHCLPNPLRGTVGCVALTALGWVPIGTLPVPGSVRRSCGRNCRCRLDYRTAADRASRAA